MIKLTEVNILTDADAGPIYVKADAIIQITPMTQGTRIMLSGAHPRTDAGGVYVRETAEQVLVLMKSPFHGQGLPADVKTPQELLDKIGVR